MNTKKSYDAQIGSAQLMVGAAKANLTALQKRGMTKTFVTALEAALKGAVEANLEQEKLKASLKASTAKLDGYLTDISEAMKEATKVVKLAMPQEKWTEFGMVAKR